MGIDWGHIPLWKPVFKRDKETVTDYAVEANTGIACVSPMWKIMEVLNQEELVKERKREERELSARLERENVSVDDVASDENKPFTQQDFEDALRKASRRSGKTK